MTATQDLTTEEVDERLDRLIGEVRAMRTQIAELCELVEEHPLTQ